jgi:hypothetical protein
MRLTHRISDTEWIETQADTNDRFLRLQANLVNRRTRVSGVVNDIVIRALKRVYPIEADNAVASFTEEWHGLTGITLTRSLFPEDLTSLRCPSAPLWLKDPIVFGVAVGTPEDPRIEYIPAEPADAGELERLAAPAHPREVFRVAGVCIREGCLHWRPGANGAEGDGKCSLVERVVAVNQPLIDHLQRCDFRDKCRWWAQEGPVACKVCPGIVTDYGEMPQSRDDERDVLFV